MCNFYKKIVEFVVHLTKIWPKYIDFCCYSKILETLEECFCPPPVTPRIYGMYCSSFTLLNLMYGRSKNTTFKENIQISHINIFG